MQRTRLTNLTAVITTKVTDLFANPWRRVALILIALLLGFFAATAITSTAGQAADLDIVAGATATFMVEAISRYVYTRQAKVEPSSSLLKDVLNSVKIGLIYGMFVEAFKLNS